MGRNLPSPLGVDFRDGLCPLTEKKSNFPFELVCCGDINRTFEFQTLKNHLQLYASSSK